MHCSTSLNDVTLDGTLGMSSLIWCIQQNIQVMIRSLQVTSYITCVSWPGTPPHTGWIEHLNLTKLRTLKADISCQLFLLSGFIEESGDALGPAHLSIQWHVTGSRHLTRPALIQIELVFYCFALVLYVCFLDDRCIVSSFRSLKGAWCLLENPKRFHIHFHS